MPPVDVLVWYLPLLVSVHVAVIYWLIRRSERSSDPSETPTEMDGIACPACGVENEPGYRFCRACISDLPGPTGRRTGGGIPTRPGIR